MNDLHEMTRTALIALIFVGAMSAMLVYVFDMPFSASDPETVVRELVKPECLK
jgi:uncharacterized membrane protein